MTRDEEDYMCEMVLRVVLAVRNRVASYPEPTTVPVPRDVHDVVVGRRYVA